MRIYFQKQSNQLALLVCCCLLFVFVVKPWQLYFLNDDFLHIPMPNQWLFLRGGFFRPVPNFVLLWDKWLYGKSAVGFFCTTLLLHAACVFSVYFLVKQLLQVYIPQQSDSLIALSTALLFLCYPFHGEALMWVIARVSIIAAMFTFISLMFYIKSATGNKYFALSWLFFLLALFTYESIWNIVLLFALLGAADLKLKRSHFKAVACKYAVMLATFIAYIFLRIYLLRSVAGDGYLEINQNLGKIKLLLINLVKLTGRNFTPPFVNTTNAIMFFGVSICVYLFLLYKMYKKQPTLGTLALFTIVAMVTAVVTAAPLGIDTHYNESDRYLYYSSLFYCLFIALAIFILLPVRLRGFVVVLFVVAYTLFFANLQKNYQHASVVTRTTVEEVAKNNGYKNAFFIDVPERYKGSMIYRIGLQDAIKWMVPEATYDSVYIVSQTETSSGIMPYKTGETSWAELAAAKHWNKYVPVIQTAAINTVIGKQDIVFWYRADGLYKVKIP